ncbi:MAG: class I SAM-dependent rRNA methyltransferase [Saprospiraceae bacterium]|nr:class I SAM-dependent rRNA methyltransferase [Saprospiraceae bacterium]
MVASFVIDPVQRLAVKLKQKSETFIRQGHPWVFESSIQKINKEGKAGDLAIIFDQKKNKYLGIGLYDPYSPIRIKMVLHTQKEAIDGNFFHTRIQAAYEIRKPLIDTKTNAYRLVFGENDFLPGLIIDVYTYVAVVKLYSAIWFPYLHHILEALLAVTSSEAVVLRLSRLLQKEHVETFGLEDGQLLVGELEDPEIEFVEYGVRFKANVLKGHKTGYFLDHRHNRHKVGQLAKGKKVLDVFSYAGGFSTHAVVGGASEVVSIDISKHALELAKINVALNKNDADHDIMVIDAFLGMQKLIDEKRYFDIVVVDPPSFAKTTADIPGAEKSYKRLAALAIQLTSHGGLCVMASCSSRIDRDSFFELIERGFDTQDRSYRLIEKTFHDVDHPISFAEGSYLKTGYYHID